MATGLYYNFGSWGGNYIFLGEMYTISRSLGSSGKDTKKEKNAEISAIGGFIFLRFTTRLTKTSSCYTIYSHDSG